ncbi:hypothetical protein C0J52_09992 [Blattella germanica]|nr:hypothetical protein C0J52_09992 [Blattella germanica]
MHEESTSRPMSVPSSVATTTTQPTATDHNASELQVSFSSSSAGTTFTVENSMSCTLQSCPVYNQYVYNAY